MNTAAIAAFSPRWWSLMTSCTPARPRARRPLQERRPERAVLGVADVDPEDLPVAGGGHAGGHDHRPGHDAPADAAFDVGGVENT